MNASQVRMTGVAAIVSVVLLFASIATWTNPQFNGPIGDITGYFVKRAALAQVSVDLNLLSGIPSLLFAVGLFLLLRSRSEDVLGYMSLAGAILVGAFFLLTADMVAMTANLFTGMLGLLLFVVWSVAIGVSLLRDPVRAPAPARAPAVPALG